eukprot:gene27962-36831_t
MSEKLRKKLCKLGNILITHNLCQTTREDFKAARAPFLLERIRAWVCANRIAVHGQEGLLLLLIVVTRDKSGAVLSRVRCRPEFLYIYQSDDSNNSSNSISEELSIITIELQKLLKIEFSLKQDGAPFEYRLVLDYTPISIDNFALILDTLSKLNCEFEADYIRSACVMDPAAATVFDEYEIRRTWGYYIQITTYLFVTDKPIYYQILSYENEPKLDQIASKLCARSTVIAERNFFLVEGNHIYTLYVLAVIPVFLHNQHAPLLYTTAVLVCRGCSRLFWLSEPARDGLLAEYSFLTDSALVWEEAVFYISKRLRGTTVQSPEIEPPPSSYSIGFKVVTWRIVGS